MRPPFPTRASATFVATLGVVLAAMVVAMPGTASAAVVTVAGTATDIGGDVWSGCDSVTANVAVSVNGAGPQVTTCDASDGTWSTSVAVSSAGDVLGAWLDTGGGDRGSLHTRTTDATSDVLALTVSAGSARVRTEDAAALTTAELALVDDAVDADIPLDVSAGALTVAAGTELLVEAGETLTATGDVTAPAIDVRGTLAGGTNTIELTSGGTSTQCAAMGAGVQMPVCVDGGTLSLAAATVRYDTTDDAVVAPPSTYGALELVASGAGSPLFELGTGNSASIDVAGPVVIGDGTNPVTVSTSTASPCMTIAGDLDVAASAQLVGYGSCTLQVVGDTSIDGTLDLAAGTFEVRAAAAVSITTSASASFSVSDLRLTNSSGAPVTVAATTDAAAPIVVRGLLQVGAGGDAATTTLDASTAQATLDVDGDVAISSQGVLQAATTAPFTIAGDFTNDGTFVPGTGTVEFDDAGRTTTLRYTAATTFYNLAVVTAGKSIRFPTTATTNVTGTTGGLPGLTVSGGSCTSLVGMSSTTPGTRAAINVTGTSSVAFADIGDMNAVAALTATDSFDAGNNLNWTSITGACPTITISGNAYSDETGTVWTGCNGATQRIGVSVAGRPQRTTWCAAGTGAYSLTVTAGSDRTVAVYFNGALTADRATTYTRTIDATSNLTGISLVRDRVQVSSENATATTNAHMSQWDSTESASIPVTVAQDPPSLGGPATWNATLTGSREFKVPAGETWLPGGDVTAYKVDVRGTLDTPGRQRIELTGSGNGGCDTAVVSSQPFCVVGSYAPGCDSATTFSATAGFTQLPTIGFHRLEFVPASGSASFSFGTAASQTVNAGEIIVGGAGGDATLSTSTVWDPRLNVTGACGADEGNLVVAAGSTFAGEGLVYVDGDFTGAGTVSRTSGLTMVQAGRDVTFGPSGTADWTFTGIRLYNLDPAGGPQRRIQVPPNAGGRVLNSWSWLQVGTSPTRAGIHLDLDSGDLPVATSTDFVLYADATVTASDTAPLDLGRNFDPRAGSTFDANGGLVRFDTPSQQSTIYRGPTFANVEIASPDKHLRFTTGTTTTVTGTMTANGGSCASTVRLRSTNPGVAATIDAAGASLQHVEVVDLVAATPLVATDSVDGGGNTGWTISNDACTPLTISGTATENQTGTTWNGCDGSTRNIRITLGSDPQRNVTCSAGDASWSATFAPLPAADQVITTHLDTNGGNKGATWTRNADQTSAIAGIGVTRDRVRLRSESATPMSRAAMDTFASSYDTDIPYGLGVSSVEVVIDAGHTFAPGLAMTMPSLDVRGTLDAGATSLTMQSDGANTDCDLGPGGQTPICVTGTFVAGTSTMIFRADGSNTRLPTNITYHDVEVWNLTTDTTATINLGTGAGQTFTARELRVDHSGTNGFTYVSGSTFAPTLDLARLWVDFDSHANLWNSTVDVSEQVYLAILTSATIQTLNLLPDTTDVLLNSSWQSSMGITNLNMRTLGATPRAVTTSSNGYIGVTGTTTVGNAADPSVTSFTVNKMQSFTTQDLTVSSKGHLLGSVADDAKIRIQDDFTMSGAMTANKQVVEFYNTQVSDITTTSPLEFHSLRVATAGKRLNFPTSAMTTVSGTTGINPGLSVAGTGCTTNRLVRLDSASGATWNLDVTGSSDIQYAQVRSSNAVTGVSATKSFSLGGNTNWTITGCNTVSGTAHESESGLVWGGCDGVTPRIAVVVNGDATTKDVVPCDAGTGAFTTGRVDLDAADRLVTLWFDAPGMNGTAATLYRTAAAGDVAGVILTRSHVRIHEGGSATAFTAATLETWDDDNDTDVPFTVTGNDIVLSAGHEFQLATGRTFTQTGSMTAASLQVGGTYNAGAGNTTGSITLTASGTGACNLDPGAQRPLCMDGGTFNNTMRVTRFTGAGSVDISSAASTWLGEIQVKPSAPGANYTLCGSGYNLMSTHGIDIGDAVNGVNVDASACGLIYVWNDTGPNANNDVLVNAGAVLTDGGSGSRDWHVYGSFSGAGQFTGANSTVYLYGPHANSVFGPTADEDWTFGSMWAQPPGGRTLYIGGATGSGTITGTWIGTNAGGTTATQGTHDLTVGAINVNNGTFSAAGSGSVDINGSLSILAGRSFLVQAATVTIAGDVSNSGTFNAGTGTTTLDGTGGFGSFTNAAGAMYLSSTGTLLVRRNLSNSGTFAPASGTVEFYDSAQTSAIYPTAAMSFRGFRVATASKEVLLDGNISVLSNFTVNGSSCSTKATIRSSTAAVQRTITMPAARSIQYARLRDVAASIATTATNSTHAGNLTNFNVSNCVMTVSGVATTDEAGATPWAYCNGATHRLAVVDSFNPGTVRTGFCNAGTGAFSIPNVPVNDVDDVILVHMNVGLATQRGATWVKTVDSWSDVGGIVVTKDRARLDGPDSFVNMQLGYYDATNDTDVPIDVDASNNLVAPSSVELRIGSGTTYDPGASVTTGALDLRGTYKSTTADANLTTITGSGTSSDCSAGPGVEAPLCISGTATHLWDFTFTSSSDLVINGTSDTRFNLLTLDPTGGTPTYTIGGSAGETIASYSHVVVGDGATTFDTVVRDGATLKVATQCPSGDGSCGTAGDLIVLANATLGGTGNVSAYGNVTGAGTMNFTGGTFTRHDFTGVGGSSNLFGSSAGAATWTFNNLSFVECEVSATPIQFNAGGTGDIHVTGNLTVSGTSLDATTNERDLDIDGSATVGVGATFSAPDTAALTVGDDLTVSGTLAPGTGTITLDTAGKTSDVTALAPLSLHNLRIATPAKPVRFDETDQVTITGTTGTYPGFTVDGAACSTLASIGSTAPGDQAQLNVTGSSSIAFAHVQDIDAVVALTAGDSTSGGNNTNMTINQGSCSLETISITAGSAPALAPSPALPGVDTSAQSTVHVTTTAVTGYTLTATDDSDTDSMLHDVTSSAMGDFGTYEPTAPATWTVGDGGTDGMFALTVLDASGGRLAKWGAGTSAADDFGTNRYLGLASSIPAVLHQTSTTTAGDDVVVGYRANAHATTEPGSYSTNVSFTVLANP